MINKFDKPTLKLLSEQIIAAVKPIAEAHGLTVKNAGGTFDVTKWTERLEFNVKQTADGTSGEEAEFKRNTQLSIFSGIRPEHYGKEFTSQGQRYTVVAFKPGCKYNVIGLRSDGKRYKFCAEDVLAKLK